MEPYTAHSMLYKKKTTTQKTHTQTTQHQSICHKIFKLTMAGKPGSGEKTLLEY